VASSSLTALAAAVLHVPAVPERILEIGCGGGDRALFLAREYPTARVRGLDASVEAVHAAVARVGLDPEGRVAFKQAGSRRLPYPDDHFDLVVQAGGRLRPGEIARVLRRYGHLILVGEWRLREWRVGSHGFEAVADGEAEGERFHVLRLHPVEREPE
jgi:ubiquinone/menaquinone biosynthesis C-methylase UbiE